MKNILLWIWQLPQNLIGFILSLFGKRYKMLNEKFNINETIVFINKFPKLGAASLGNYIIIFKGNYSYFTLMHELGHTRQSLFTGWFYLIVVGLISVIRNVYDRIFHKKWNSDDRYKWYYNGYPEKQANELSKKNIPDDVIADFIDSISL